MHYLQIHHKIFISEIELTEMVQKYFAQLYRPRKGLPFSDQSPASCNLHNF
jgi:hypothetical protein